ncbi:uncharacterized protein LOC114284030 [Camellia sinensis]|uniref:uncharacterized protein LOC114284030 n=1 Tax=Camellia sinensis TaxID=4442 RepID=UPI001035D341|nr:uncharacterized protein LOC114284030 [Camellia sinensis]
MKTIYNVCHRFKVKKKVGRSQMKQLLGKLAEHKYIEWHRCEQNTMVVIDLLWAHPFSLDLFHAFPRVLIMDSSTYLQFERTDNYVWALNILRGLMDENIFPEVIVTDRELALMNAIDVCIRPYIKHVKDVSPDGHCGFRSIAGLIGRGEDHWVEVRHDLLQELHTYNDLYTKLYESFKRIEELAYSLTYFDAKPA